MTRHQTIKLLRLSILFSVTLIVVGYALFRSLDYIRGPEIVLNNPENYSTIKESSTLFEGYALRVSDIWLNDRPITLAEDGYFREVVLLNPGLNTITIKVKDRFEREDNKSLTIIRKDF